VETRNEVVVTSKVTSFCSKNHDFQSKSFEEFDEHTAYRNMRTQFHEQRITLLCFREYKSREQRKFPRILRIQLCKQEYKISPRRTGGDKLIITGLSKIPFYKDKLREHALSPLYKQQLSRAQSRDWQKDVEDLLDESIDSKSLLLRLGAKTWGAPVLDWA
jgi:hypothetical protein